MNKSVEKLAIDWMNDTFCFDYSGEVHDKDFMANRHGNPVCEGGYSPETVIELAFVAGYELAKKDLTTSEGEG